MDPAGLASSPDAARPTAEAGPTARVRASAIQHSSPQALASFGFDPGFWDARTSKWVSVLIVGTTPAKYKSNAVSMCLVFTRPQMSFVKKIRLKSKNSRKPVLRYFDEVYYLRAYPDVAVHDLSPLEHYLLIGWKDRNNPGPEFSTQGYLDANPDVAAIRVCPLLHFLQHGMAEGRTGWEKNAFGG